MFFMGELQRYSNIHAAGKVYLLGLENAEPNMDGVRAPTTPSLVGNAPNSMIHFFKEAVLDGVTDDQIHMGLSSSVSLGQEMRLGARKVHELAAGMKKIVDTYCDAMSARMDVLVKRLTTLQMARFLVLGEKEQTRILEATDRMVRRKMKTMAEKAGETTQAMTKSVTAASDEEGEKEKGTYVREVFAVDTEVQDQLEKQRLRQQQDDHDPILGRRRTGWKEAYTKTQVGPRPFQQYLAAEKEKKKKKKEKERKKQRKKL